MTSIVLAASEGQRWDDYARRCPGCDIYHMSDYHRAFEANGDGAARAVVVEKDDQVFFHPLMVRAIERVGAEAVPGSWSDAETVYGYSGPLASTTDAAFLRAAWAEVDAFCARERIVTEFVRFNPLSENHVLLSREETLAERETVIVDLGGSGEEFWRRYPSVQRNMIRKAEKAGLSAEEENLADSLPSFRALYEENMQRVSARDYYFFRDEHYEWLSAKMEDRVRLFVVRREGEAVAGALLLIHGDRLHYHLSAARPDARVAAPANLLLHAGAMWGRRNGCRWMHLGGGRTAAPDDSLLAFKASVSRLRRMFYIGRRLHDQVAYDTLCGIWARQHAGEQRPRYFQLYRL
ncbi:MAG: GNAT family N-acetyltransferase [Kiritimatiellae bacterium]|nr:GNAT family N-acetyltransferase [Kiritimatiellia bacterium]